MRRWVCIVALLAGFGPVESGWRVRPRQPIAIERPLERYRGRDGLPTTAEWWLRP